MGMNEVSGIRAVHLIAIRQGTRDFDQKKVSTSPEAALTGW